METKFFTQNIFIEQLWIQLTKKKKNKGNIKTGYTKYETELLTLEQNGQTEARLIPRKPFFANHTEVS